MRSNARFGLAAMAVAALGVAIATPAARAGGALEVTPERAKICAEAQKRYEKQYPDAKDDGAVVVLLYKYNFCPANVTIKVGTTVRWMNIDTRTSHSVWMKEAGQAESERFFPDEQWEFPFQATGDYPYLCGPHWKAEGMIGYVKVVE